MKELAISLHTPRIPLHRIHHVVNPQIWLDFCEGPLKYISFFMYKLLDNKLFVCNFLQSFVSQNVSGDPIPEAPGPQFENHWNTERVFQPHHQIPLNFTDWFFKLY